MKVGSSRQSSERSLQNGCREKQGLGYILTYASSTYDTPMLLAGIIVTIILGIATYQVISVLEDKFRTGMSQRTDKDCACLEKRQRKKVLRRFV